MEASTNTIGLQSRLTHALMFFAVLGYSRMSSERFNSEIRLPYMVSLHGNKLLFQTKCIEEQTRQRLSGIIALVK